MQRRYPLTDYEAHIVRETPEMGWDADTTREAEDHDRLPIDLPVMDCDGQAPDVVSPGVFRIVMGAALVVILGLWVLL